MYDSDITQFGDPRNVDPLGNTSPSLALTCMMTIRKIDSLYAYTPGEWGMYFMYKFSTIC